MAKHHSYTSHVTLFIGLFVTREKMQTLFKKETKEERIRGRRVEINKERKVEKRKKN
jgi:uncharacterized membrane protein